MKFDVHQLAAALAAAGVALPVNFFVADREYRALKKDFLAGKFGHDLRAWIFELFGKYQPECRDCDDFARFAAALAQLWHSTTPGHGGAALAFGEFWHVQDNGAAHAINVALVEGGEVVFYEPQTQRLVELTETERGNATMIRF